MPPSFLWIDLKLNPDLELRDNPSNLLEIPQVQVKLGVSLKIDPNKIKSPRLIIRHAL